MHFLAGFLGVNCELSNDTISTEGPSELTTISDEPSTAGPTTVEPTTVALTTHEPTTIEATTITPCVNDTDDCSGHYICNDTQRVCREGWTGVYCMDRDFDGSAPFDPECPSSGGVCKNGGTCFKKGCCCRVGFEGNLCQGEINECASLPCLNGGLCFDRLNAYECRCLPGEHSVYVQALNAI